MIIVILGPDGCGKTTIANELVHILSLKKVKAKHSAMHFEILPKLKDLVNPFLKNKIDSSHEEGEYHAGMKAKPNSTLKGIVYVVWYALDYFLGHIRLWKSNRKKEITIFARYYYDYYFQRGHINTPHSVIRLFEFFIPQPTFIFTISRPAKDIFDLKPELSIDEIERQQKAIESLFKKRKNAFIIDGTSGIDATVKNIQNLIKEKI